MIINKWDEWPVRQSFLLFGTQAFHEHKYLDFYLSLIRDLTVYEVIRNVPIRHPLLWGNSRTDVAYLKIDNHQ